MSSGIEQGDTMFSVREVPWHGQGVVLERAPKDVAEALKLSGLDWEVVQEPLYTKVGTQRAPDYLGVEGYVANMRKDTGDVIGVVSPRYTVVQNAEAFAFLDTILGGDVEWETAGSLRKQRRIWCLCRVPGHVEIAGDAHVEYMLVQNRHDGFGALAAYAVVIRVVCQNTITAAIQGASRSYSLRHVGDPTNRIYDARKALDVTVNYGQALKAFGDKLALEKISEKRLLDRVLKELYPDGTTDRATANAVEMRDGVLLGYKEGDTVGASPGTKWSAYQAIIEQRDWDRPVQGETSRFGRALDDSTKQRALGLILAA